MRQVEQQQKPAHGHRLCRRERSLYGVVLDVPDLAVSRDIETQRGDEAERDRFVLNPAISQCLPQSGLQRFWKRRFELDWLGPHERQRSALLLGPSHTDVASARGQIDRSVVFAIIGLRRSERFRAYEPSRFRVYKSNIARSIVLPPLKRADDLLSELVGSGKVANGALWSAAGANENVCWSGKTVG